MGPSLCGSYNTEAVNRIVALSLPLFHHHQRFSCISKFPPFLLSRHAARVPGRSFRHSPALPSSRTMSLVTPTTTMPQHEMDGLMETLRRANALHSQLAAASRALSHPAHKARKQAKALRLSISVEAASTLNHKYISAIPLPVLELVPSPPPDMDHAIFVADATSVVIAAPVPRYPFQIATHGLAKTTTRPALRCVIPTITVQEHIVSSVPDLCTLGSKWSASTTGSGETEVEDDEEGTIEPDIPQPAQIRVRYARADDNENMDILVSPDDSDDSDDYDQEGDEAPPQNNQVLSQRPPLPTRIPRQAAPAWQKQVQKSSPREGEAGLAHFSSGSDTSQSSLELATPVSISVPYFLTPI